MLVLGCTAALARVPNTGLVLDEPPASEPGTMRLERAFPQLAFRYPILLIEFPDGSGRLAVVEREGLVRVFPRSPDPAPEAIRTFLDLTGLVSPGPDEGLLSIAFDPDFGLTGELYAFYLRADGSPFGSCRVSRFSAGDPAAESVDPATERVLFDFPRPEAGHMGGMIAFGPDGLLYAGMGDGSATGDPAGLARDPASPWGKILRVDARSSPDPGLAYAIPPGNPFASDPDDSTRLPEIWASGLRNPWRWSFDPLHGHMYLSDVGTTLAEEMNVGRAGADFGWSAAEGYGCRPGATDCDPTALTPPILAYPSYGGRAIIGGFVHRAASVPELRGVHVYADFMARFVGGVRYDGALARNWTLVEPTDFAVAGLGTDAEGEVYLLEYAPEGAAFVLRPEEPAPPSDLPPRLSEHPVLYDVARGLDRSDAGVFAYEPSAKLWSDGALKERFVAMPGLEGATWRDDVGWDFPEATTLVKNFRLPLDERRPDRTALRIETRLLVKNGGEWRGYSYEWSENGLDATLLTGGKSRSFVRIDREGRPYAYEWTYPSPSQCMSCHTQAANRALGLNVAQMNHATYDPHRSSGNQIRALESDGFFAAPVPGPVEAMPAAPDPEDEGVSIRDRARAYLAANCSHCHRPGGPTTARFDARWNTSDDRTGLIDVAPDRGTLGIVDARLVAPGDPGRSVLLQRMRARGESQMPPLGTSIVDEDALGWIEAWILELGRNAATEWSEYE